jgi:hypothetical protein
MDHDWSDTEGFVYCKTCGTFGLIAEKNLMAGTASGHSVEVDAPVLSILEPEAVIRILKAAEGADKWNIEVVGEEYTKEDSGPFGELYWALKEITF